MPAPGGFPVVVGLPQLLAIEALAGATPVPVTFHLVHDYAAWARGIPTPP